MRCARTSTARGPRRPGTELHSQFWGSPLLSEPRSDAHALIPRGFCETGAQAPLSGVNTENYF
jgi:hypothetical protein